ncbi:MAG: CBS domain-containing protein [Candidatus Omnitrophota bacterium]|nr:MAG: CBS domain-containing protein [Candidatus Omnitrophota bacterium]
MDLIVTHVGADFDALASVIAAQKLYPQAKAILPGSAQKNVREFLSLWKDEFRLDTEKEIDLDSVTRLIIVETRLKSRIGMASQIVDKGEVEIHIFDHHPKTKQDIKPEKEISANVGATVSLLVKIIKKRKMPLTPIEATVMALGIYEDTNSLTSQTTTKLDIDVVGFLFSQGANLSAVSSYLKRELTQRQLSILSDLINKTEVVTIKGIDIAISFLKIEKFVEDFALLVHKLIDIENFNVLFAFAEDATGTIRMVARSNLSYINIAKVTSHFGGGGHPYAASAKIKGISSEQVKLKLLNILKRTIRPKIYAEDIGSFKIRTVSPDETINEVRKLMKKLKVTGMAVAEKDRLVGIITKADLAKAIHRGFGHSRIKGYMNIRPVTTTSKAPLQKIRRLMLEEDVGYLPIVKRGKLLGMVTREDLLKVVYHDLITPRKSSKRKRPFISPVAVNVSQNLKSRLPGHIYNILKFIGKRADNLHYKAFCVGGFIRDLLLGVENFDIDIVVEKNAIRFGKILASKLKGSLVVHKKFGTATIVMPWTGKGKRGPEKKKEKFKIDIATARTEQYPYPAALPTVKFASIKQDLYRRDFTINAMAVSVNRNNFGDLIDFFGGQRDLKMKKIRILHNLSFLEDPTRIFRAVRFEQRYNFRIEPHTEELIKTAVTLDMFGRTQKQRIRDEIILILSEDKPIKALLGMNQLHELRFIDPKLKLNKDMIKLFESIEETCAWYKLSFMKKRVIDSWIIYFMAMVNSLALKEIKSMCERFVFTKGDTKRLLSAKMGANRIAQLLDRKEDMKPSQIYMYLEPLSYEVILFIMAKTKTKEAKGRISLFFTKYNSIKLRITGIDLKKIGLTPGPTYKKVLNKILYAKLDGRIKSKQDEIGLAEKLIGKTK